MRRFFNLGLIDGCLLFAFSGQLLGHALLHLVISAHGGRGERGSLGMGVDLVDERHVDNPINEDKSDDGQRRANTLNKTLKP